MGLRGPATIPTPLKILKGTAKKKDIERAKKEPKPQAIAPVCPDWLYPEAKAEWSRLVPELERIGLLTMVDGMSLACLCQAWAEFCLATKILASEGHVMIVGGEAVDIVRDEDGTIKSQRWVGGQPQPHPMVSQQRTAWKAVKDFCAVFGLNPSSRTRIEVPTKQAGPRKVETRKRG